jgi:membrane fusion protein (multidrug efflux system)
MRGMAGKPSRRVCGIGALLLLLTAPLAAAQTPRAPAPDSGIGVQVVARLDAVIGAPMAGRLLEFPLRDGDRFKSGDVLARFACAQVDAVVARSKATLGKKQRQLDISAKLRQLGTNNAAEYQLAVSEVAEAQADLVIADANAESCVVHAPFAGRVGNVTARNFEWVTAGAPLLELVSERELELELILPSRWLAWLQDGTSFTAHIQETGQTYQATIVRLSGKVDSISQSVKAYARITGAAPGLLPGMSGQAELSPPTSPK